MSQELKLFETQLERELTKILPDIYTLEFQKVEKNGRMIDAMIVKRKDVETGMPNACPIFYTSTLFEEYLENKGVLEIREYAIKVSKNIERFSNNGKNFTVENLFKKIEDFEKVKEHIAIKVVNGDSPVTNKTVYGDTAIDGLLKQYILDMPLECEEQGYNIVVSSDLLSVWGKTEKEIDSVAMENIGNMAPYIKRMDEVVGEIEKAPSNTGVMIVASLGDMVNGASVIFRTDAMESISKSFEDMGLDKNFFVIPSSIHEIVAFSDVPEKMGESCLEMLEELVFDTNLNFVDSCDFLSNNVYRYNAESGGIENESKRARAKED